MPFEWRSDAGPDGVTLTCVRKGMFSRGRTVPPADWPDEAERPGRDLLDYLVQADQATLTTDGVMLPHAVVAGLTEAQASRLGLPPTIPHALQVRSHRRLDEPAFALEQRWMRFGTQPVRIDRTGAMATEGDSRFRIPAALLHVIEAVETFRDADTTDHEARIQAWTPVQEALAAATGTQVAADGYLADLRLFHAASFSLAVDMDAHQGVTFDPVLFGRAAVQRTGQGDLFDEDDLADPAAAEEAGETIAGRDTLADEADALLTPEQHRVFLNDRWQRYPETRGAYALGRNTYVMLDPALKTALDTVRRVRAGSDAERRAFLKAPRAVLAEALEQDADSPLLSALFVETRQFADRVVGIGLWQPKVLPWLPRPTSGWLPERIGFVVGGRSVEIAPEHIPAARAACEAAINTGHVTFKVEGVGEPLPATAEALDSLQKIEPIAKRMVAARAPDPPDPPDPDNAPDTAKNGEKDEQAPADRTVLETGDNLESLDYTAKAEPRATPLEARPPADLMAPDRLFPHQNEGFRWLVRSWCEGRPGVLLADDMGLGKTIQTLAFAAWLHAHFTAGHARRGPFLIVAPTALLRNWRAEHDAHLLNGGLGPLAELYGGGVARFRRQGEQGRDVAVGHGVLDREALEQQSIILTTYETMANYHISLAGIRFPLVVFDEIQKIKTPTTINTHAAKTLNADFVIGLTGTPVENSLSDLWSIMDRLHPGLLGDLKAFNARYRADEDTDLRLLHETLTEARHGAPIMLRRMKDATDLGKALPARTYQPLPRAMPPVQAEAYAEIILAATREKAAGAGRGAMLEVLHKMRGVSLHPDHPETVLGQPALYDDYIRRSARLTAAVETLDSIHAAGEKALLFIEVRAMQDLMAEILRHRYGLPGRPAIINGATPSARRQTLVGDFQADPVGRFNVMILSPRAAGVGLTITAANHVIHLSRWWNPAVEDQCNDRAYRIGQDKPVTVYTPIARHPEFGEASFDVTLDALLTRKRRLSRDLLVPAESNRDYQDMFDRTVSGAG